MKGRGGTMTMITHNEVQGLHRWVKCPKGHGHEYLKAKHRHTFVIECGFTVTHNDREKEIFDMQDVVEHWIRQGYRYHGDGLYDFGGASCEMIALYIAGKVDADWVEVREDGKGGARYARQ